MTESTLRPGTKNARHQQIVDLVTHHEVRSQGELAALLVEQGVSVTQATLSRDLLELDAVKIRAASGALVKADFITGVGSPLALAVSEGSLFVLEYNGQGTPGTIGKFDAATGALKWEYHKVIETKPAFDGRMRSLAIYKDRIYLNTPDAHIVALDARSGKVAPIPIRERPMRDAQATLDDLRAGKVTGRVVLTN